MKERGARGRARERTRVKLATREVIQDVFKKGDSTIRVIRRFFSHPKVEIFFPSVAIFVTLACVWGAWKGIELVRGARTSALELSLQEQSSVLSLDVRNQLEAMVQRLNEIAENEQAHALTEGDWSIFSLSIWSKQANNHVATRDLELTQSRFLTPAQEEILRSKRQERLQRIWTEPAFRGLSTLTVDPTFDPTGIAILVMPMSEGRLINRVVAAHIRLAGIQRAFDLHLTHESFLMNSEGRILAHPDKNRIGQVDRGLAKVIFQVTLGAETESHEGVTRFVDPQGIPRLAVYRKIPMGNLAVVSAIPLDLLSVNKTEITAFVIAMLTGLGFLLIGGATGIYIWVARRKAFAKLRGKENVGSTQEMGLVEPSLGDRILIDPEEGTRFDFQSPERQHVCVLHVAVGQYDQALAEMEAGDVVEVLNDFFTIGKVLAKRHGGVFERVSGASWCATWATIGPDCPEVKSGLKCALALRDEYSRMNEARKLDGHKPLTVTMGADWGLALTAKIGPDGSQTNSVVGEVISHARALAQLAISMGKDLLISQALWSRVEGNFVGTHEAEASLTAASGLTACYSVQGYRDQAGNPVLVREPTIQLQIPEGQPKLQEVIVKDVRWMVNTGSSILGPLTPSDVAQRLYSMDLDFDCECWIEGKGIRLPLSKSGIFGGSEEPDAILWVFDGISIHGPMSEGFLKTALQHGAVSPSSFACERSTVNGWRPVTDFAENVSIPVFLPQLEPARTKGTATSTDTETDTDPATDTDTDGPSLKAA